MAIVKTAFSKVNPEWQRNLTEEEAEVIYKSLAEPTKKKHNKADLINAIMRDEIK